MTTIAYKDGVMACDSMWTDFNGYPSTFLTKITRLKSGALVGGAGDNDDRAVIKLLDRVHSFDQMPSALDLANTRVDYAGIIVFVRGKIEVAQISIEFDEKRGGWNAMTWPITTYTAIGTGSGPALGAMAAGAAARRAVEIAVRLDPNCRGPVHSVPLREPKGYRPQ